MIPIFFSVVVVLSLCFVKYVKLSVEKYFVNVLMKFLG